MRIIAGKWRGLRLAPVGKGDAAAHLRPTAERVRESLFNVLSGGALDTVLAGARVLDLFAGTGALGLEALSRGAGHACLVDNGKRAQAMIRRNIALCGAQTQSILMRQDATRLGRNPGAPHSLIFLDPPYGKGLGERALLRARAGGWVAHGAVVVAEDSAPMPSPEGFDLHAHRRYGNTWITIMRAVDERYRDSP